MFQGRLCWLDLFDCWSGAYGAFRASVVREGLTFGALGF